MKQLLLFVFLLSLHTPLQAQVSFLDKSSEVFGAIGFEGDTRAVTDINNDGLDDIAYLNELSNVVIRSQNDLGGEFSKKTLGHFGFGPQWSICIADLDNNGENEVLCGGYYEPIEIYNTSNSDGDQTLYGILPNSDQVFVQGTNVVDVDNDGHLDVFTCHDDGANFIWENDGSGQFIVNSEWIDFSINGSHGEDASGNYGSIWTDIDYDGDIDLYIAKCRAHVTDPTDSRRINTLYINNGDGTFTEKAEEFGLAIGWQSWTADFQDINNDGLFDVFITNHDFLSQVFLNDGDGIFTEVENSGLNITGEVFQGVMRDFDNDGWVDIFTAGFDGHQLYLNNKDNTFTKIEGVFGDTIITSYALGDLNSDGYIDVFAGYRNIGDKAWMNAAESGNHHFAVRLQGTISNRSAIGAKVEIYGDWGIQIREVRSGESYGIMNSMTQYFGLGQSETIDSMVIRWPSGIIQTEYNLDINSKVLIIEKCTFDAPGLNIEEEDLVLCNGESLTLSLEEEYASYEWNDGSTSPEIIVTTAGTYYVMLEDEIGCTSSSQAVNVDFDSALTPTIEVVGNEELCAGETTILIKTNQDDVDNQMWSDGSQADSLIVDASGVYTYTQENACGTFTSNEIEIAVFEYPTPPQTMGDSIFPNETAYLSAEGMNISWYEDETSIEVIGTGNQLVVENLEESAIFYATESSGDGLCEGDRAPATVFVEEELSDDNTIKEEVIHIFQNQASKILQVNLSENIDLPVMLEILDVNGGLISRTPIRSNETSINVDNFNNRIYIVKVIRSKSVFSKMIFIH